MAGIDSAIQKVRSIFTRPEPPVGTGYSEDFANLVNEEFDRRRRERRPWELGWRLNMAFVDGRQLLEIDPYSQTLKERPKLYWYEEREVFNQLAPIVEVRHAKLSRIRHILKVRPASGERRDIMAAKTSSKLLVYVQNEQSLRQKLCEAIMWAEVLGDGFLKSTWNRNAGRVAGVLVDETTGQEIEIYEGDVEVSVHSPFEIYPDNPRIPQVERQRSIIHAAAYHVDEIEDIWGVRVEPEDVDIYTLQPSIGQGGLGYGAGAFRISNVKVKNHAVVKEFWEMPSRRYTSGRLLVVIRNKTVHAGTVPLLIGKGMRPGYPWDKVPCIIRPGWFWDKSPVERGIPIQRRYNNLRNRKQEYLNRVAIGQLYVEEGSTDLDHLENEAGAPGAIITYARGTNPPQPARYAPLPAAFDTEEARLLNEFIILSGVSEIAKQSNAPAGVKSGVALSIALEQDDTRLSATAGNIELALIEQGKKWLRLYKQFGEGLRVARCVGKDNEAEIFEWSKSDLTSDDVIVEGGSGLAESPAQRRQMVFDLVGAGVLDPRNPAHRSKLLELVEFGAWELADDEQQRLQAARAERENMRMSLAELVAVEFYDDHVIHADRHLRFVLTAEFEELQAANQAAAQMILEHLKAHLAAQATTQMQSEGGATGAVLQSHPIGPNIPTSSPVGAEVGQDLRNPQATA